MNLRFMALIFKITLWVLSIFLFLEPVYAMENDLESFSWKESLKCLGIACVLTLGYIYLRSLDLGPFIEYPSDEPPLPPIQYHYDVRYYNDYSVRIISKHEVQDGCCNLMR